MNSEEIRAALEVDTLYAWAEPWKRHVRVLQEYVLELTEALREYEAEQQASTRADAISRPNSHVSETDFGNIGGSLDALSEAKRKKAGYPATREEMVKALREAKVRLYHVPLASELVYRIDDILSREKS